MESAHIVIALVVVLFALPEILSVILNRGRYGTERIDELEKRVDELERDPSGPQKPATTETVRRS